MYFNYGQVSELLKCVGGATDQRKGNGRLVSHIDVELVLLLTG